MKNAVRLRALASLLLLAAVACKSHRPALENVKMAKDKNAAQPASTFDARDTLYAVAEIDNPPEKGKVLGRLVIVDVPGQQPGPIPSLETTLDLTGGTNQVNFNFIPPTAGWPNGKYQLQVVLLDGTGRQQDQKSADFTTAGNAPADEPAPAGAATTQS
jgi:hypothetical protein